MKRANWLNVLRARDVMKEKDKKEKAMERMYAYGKELIEDGDGTMVIGWYDDDEGNCIKDRD